MAGIGNFSPKTQAFASIENIQNLVLNPQFFEPWKQKFIRNNQNEASRVKIHAPILGRISQNQP